MESRRQTVDTISWFRPITPHARKSQLNVLIRSWIRADVSLVPQWVRGLRKCCTSRSSTMVINEQQRCQVSNVEAVTWSSSRTLSSGQLRLHRPYRKQNQWAFAHPPQKLPHAVWHHIFKWNSRPSWLRNSFNESWSSSTYPLRKRQLKMCVRSLRRSKGQLSSNKHPQRTTVWPSVDRPKYLFTRLQIWETPAA